MTDEADRSVVMAVSVTAVLNLVIIELMPLSSLFMMVRGANSPDHLKLGRFPTHWDLSAFRGQTWLLVFIIW